MLQQTLKIGARDLRGARRAERETTSAAVEAAAMEGQPRFFDSVDDSLGVIRGESEPGDAWDSALASGLALA